ncbi:MAG TPA: hypothetical protein PLB62_09730 [Candidatus Sumerlaeota bacterium]|nr:hypothetical protein [Candidatus Sumerlaeota bacterium]
MRFSVYTVILFGLVASLPLIFTRVDMLLFREGGITEWVQFSLLVATTGIFCTGFNISPQCRGSYAALATVSGFAAVRELDSLFDRVIPVLGWQGPATLLVFCGIYLILKNRATFMKGLGTLISGRAFMLMWCGFIVAVPFAQMVGHSKFLKQVMGNYYKRDYKRIIEESGEVLGYIFILLGAIEAILYCRKAMRQARLNKS